MNFSLGKPDSGIEIPEKLPFGPKSELAPRPRKKRGVSRDRRAITAGPRSGARDAWRTRMNPCCAASVSTSPPHCAGPIRLLRCGIAQLERIPYSALALLPRAAMATVFWNSAQTKLANWDTTIELFTDEYKVPALSPDFAAHLALGIELSTPVLLVLGLFSRGAALVMLGMTAFIEIFVYPQAWPTHIQWAAMLMFLISHGPGTLSVDHFLARRFAKRPDAASRPIG